MAEEFWSDKRRKIHQPTDYPALLYAQIERINILGATIGLNQDMSLARAFSSAIEDLGILLIDYDIIGLDELKDETTKTLENTTKYFLAEHMNNAEMVVTTARIRYGMLSKLLKRKGFFPKERKVVIFDPNQEKWKE